IARWRGGLPPSCGLYFARSLRVSRSPPRVRARSQRWHCVLARRLLGSVESCRKTQRTPPRPGTRDTTQWRARSIRRMIQRALFSVSVFLTFTTALLAQGNPDWHRPFPAFKIAGNLYYVGTADLAVYLITTPEGNILINSDFEQDVPLIRASIEKLSFQYADTKILLISHAHADHDAATSVIQ